MFFSKRNRIIKRAVQKTVSEFSDRTPKIYEHLYYGAFDIAPQNLVIWYLFETDAELEAARKSGFCDELAEATIRNLSASGYPTDAFKFPDTDTANITFCNAQEEEQQDILHSHIYRKVMVSFTTKEDIDNKAHGDYRLYFQ